jgi:hypothetical protein
LQETWKRNDAIRTSFSKIEVDYNLLNIIENVTNTHMVAMKHIEEYTIAVVIVENEVTFSARQTTKMIEIVECSDGVFSDEELLIVVKDLKFNEKEPTLVQSPVSVRAVTTGTSKCNNIVEYDSEVHVASDPPMLVRSWMGPEVDSTPNGVAAKGG